MKRVYRLAVEYPEGSLEPGWEPEDWEAAGDYQITEGPDAGSWERLRFTWPRERSYLAKSGAEHAADVFREYGAKVTVEASNPVTWPGDAAKGES